MFTKRRAQIPFAVLPTHLSLLSARRCAKGSASQLGQAGIKFEIRSTKLETNSNSQKDNDPNGFGREQQCLLGASVIASFGFVSDFEIRASNFYRALLLPIWHRI
jgi:hypothetical protein